MSRLRAAAVALLVSGCATVPVAPQVPATPIPVVQSTPTVTPTAVPRAEGRELIPAYAGDELADHELAVLEGWYRPRAKRGGALEVVHITMLDGLPVETPSLDEAQRPIAVLPGVHVLEVVFHHADGKREASSSTPEEVRIDARAGQTYVVAFERRGGKWVPVVRRVRI